MFVHNVLFWLKKDLTKAERAAFVKGIKMLAALPSVRNSFIGKPAKTDRPIIDRTYSYGLTVVFDDLAGHDAYQIHPDHLKFIEKNKAKWAKVKIYDFE